MSDKDAIAGEFSSWKADLESHWDTATERAKDREEFEKVIEPRREALKERGLSPGEATKQLFETEEKLRADPENTIDKLHHHYAGPSASGPNLDAETVEAEWQNYVQDRPDAAPLKMLYGQVLLANPPKEGESIRAALERVRSLIDDTHEVTAAWRNLTQAHPDAVGLREEMVKESRVNPRKPGETMAAAMKRAYDAVKPKPEGQNWSRSASWRNQLESDWNHLARNGGANVG